ncbi:hypothetical protein SHELI_v1c04780 [Spiroplasma helicoides]|uniref:Lipoprotein n=1 Tax=Spiroplasma helicoides TaxID=216938 RepID=A0A1B3SKG9_9MOLU|nr:hypothetical protein [Spiroplasma helicoides]AOG60429.1 hypothetical protein SHELI_v1c04780 [Spiroplasma helicoides]
MKKLLWKLSTCFSILLTPVLSISCNSSINDYPDYMNQNSNRSIMSKITDYFNNSKKLFNNKTAVLDEIKILFKDNEYIVFDKTKTPKQDDYLIEIEDNRILEKNIIFNILITKASPKDNNYYFDETYCQKSELSVNRKVEDVDAVLIDKNEIANTPDSPIASFVITNLDKLVGVELVPKVSNPFYGKWEYDKEQKNKINISMQQFSGSANFEIFNFDVTAKNATKSASLRVTNFYKYQNSEIVVDKSSQKVDWGQKFAFTITNYKKLKNVKVNSSNYNFQENVVYDQKTGIITGYAFGQKENNSFNENTYVTLIISAVDLEDRKLDTSVYVNINKLNLIKNLDENQNTLTLVNGVYKSFDINENVYDLKLTDNISLNDTSNYLFENGKQINKRSWTFSNEKTLKVQSWWYANRKPGGRFTGEATFKTIVDGITFTDKIKNYSINMSTSYNSEDYPKISVFDNNSGAKFESLDEDNTYLDFSADSANNCFNLYTSSSLIAFKFNTDWYRRINEIKEFLNDPEIVVDSIFSQITPEQNKKQYELDISIDIEKLKIAKSTVMQYNIGESNLNDFKINIFYKEG